LLILARLHQSPCPVTELAEAIGMEQSAISHQLRLLRNLGLVAGKRTGKRIIYGLYDNHVAMLLDEAVYHSEHLRQRNPAHGRGNRRRHMIVRQGTRRARIGRRRIASV
jgi:DNA-binding transcriptional ArsR family regulator